MKVDPNAEPIGRQPSNIQIVPSQSYPWYGSIVHGRRDRATVTGGDPLTEQQVAALGDVGRQVADVELITVKRQATMRELWWPLDQSPPIFAFQCPIVHHRADGRVKIIAPNGQPKLVDADGWAGRTRMRAPGRG